MKAQFWSFDAIFAVIVFMTAMMLLFIAWFDIAQQFSLSTGYGVGALQDQLQIMQNRILYNGVPSNWNLLVSTTDASTWRNVSVGFGSGNNVTLSTSKFVSFMGMATTNYQSTKSLLGIGYEYYIVLNSPYFSNVSVGLNPKLYNATSIQVANKQVFLDSGVPANMKIMIWTNRSFGVS